VAAWLSNFWISRIDLWSLTLAFTALPYFIT
jgi:hypothetical protein